MFDVLASSKHAIIEKVCNLKQIIEIRLLRKARHQVRIDVDSPQLLRFLVLSGVS
jgi:hypothetical protein